MGSVGYCVQPKYYIVKYRGERANAVQTHTLTGLYKVGLHLVSSSHVQECALIQYIQAAVIQLTSLL